MSGNRFHNKFHKHNHDTLPTNGDIDSATDPIASASDPFQGDFNLDGALIADEVEATTGTIDDLTATDVLTDTLGSNATSEVTMESDLDLNGNSLNGLSLSGLADVGATGTVAVNQVLKWDGVKWTNAVTPIATDSIGLNEIEDIWGAGLTPNAGKIDSTSTTPIGGMIMWMSDLAVPTGWVECNGQGLLIATYPLLNTALNGVYGYDAYPGPTEFYVPDM